MRLSLFNTIMGILYSASVTQLLITLQFIFSNYSNSCLLIILSLNEDPCKLQLYFCLVGLNSVMEPQLAMKRKELQFMY